MSIGLDDKKSKKKINLTQLRRNTRCRADKKSGRKAPRPGDYEINPAPDSVSFTQGEEYEADSQASQPSTLHSEMVRNFVLACMQYL